MEVMQQSVSLNCLETMHCHRWNTGRCRSEYDPLPCANNKTIAKFFNVKALTEEHLTEYRKQFFVGPKSNWTVCSVADLSVQSPVREYWK